MRTNKNIRVVAGVLTLFLIGTFASQITSVLTTFSSRISAGAKVARETVKVVKDTKEQLRLSREEIGKLQSELGILQGKIRAGTATQEEVQRVEVIVEKIKEVQEITSPKPDIVVVQGTPGPVGPPGKEGARGEPGQSASTTTTTRPRVTTTTTTSCILNTNLSVAKAKLVCGG